jgi:hypothetical protein
MIVDFFLMSKSINDKGDVSKEHDQCTPFDIQCDTFSYFTQKDKYGEKQVFLQINGADIMLEGIIEDIGIKQ